MIQHTGSLERLAVTQIFVLLRSLQRFVANGKQTGAAAVLCAASPRAVPTPRSRGGVHHSETGAPIPSTCLHCYSQTYKQYNSIVFT